MKSGKILNGYKGLYQVSNFGRIKRLNYWNGHNFEKGDKILKVTARKQNDCYARSVVKLYKDGSKKNFKVHRLVANAFIPNPYNYNIINHIDGNPLNNDVDNLEWCNQKYNMQQAFSDDNCCMPINGIDRETLIELLNNNYTYSEISGMLGIATGTIHNYIKKFNIRKKYI